MGKVSVKNKFCKKCSIADAWINGNIAKYQWKLSGRRSADFNFLYPGLKCSTCAFTHKNVTIPIGEKAYTNVCTNIDAWFDGYFISAVASLVWQDVPQHTHVPYPKWHVTVNFYTRHFQAASNR
jgi:hypothetical protein